MTKPLPYDTANFDAVLAVRVIHHGYTKNIHRILSEVDRVLRKRGLIFLQVPAYEVETFDEGTIWAEPGTLIARSGPEKGVPHHYFTRRELRRLMANYDMLEIHAGSQHYAGYCIIARKRETLAT